MELFRRAVGNYWVAYYLVYVAMVVWGCWANWNRLDWSQAWRDDVYLLAAILGVAAGVALMTAIIVEVFGRMVLLIPKAWNKAKEEGRQEERKRLKAAYKARYQEAYERFGIEVGGVLTLPLTPEVEQFLAGEADEVS